MGSPTTPGYSNLPSSVLNTDNTIIELKLDFDSTLGLFLTFWGPNGLFFGLGKGPNTVLGSTHVVGQLYFSMLP